MNEQILKDLVATAQKYNYDWNTVISKFPEFNGYDPQLLKDYVATAEKHNYDYNVVNSKFPEFKIKKKEPTASPSGQPKAKSSSATSGKETDKPSVGSGLTSKGGVWGRMEKGKFVPISDAEYRAIQKVESTKSKLANQNKEKSDASNVYKGDVNKRDDLFTGYPGKENKIYRLDNSTGKPVWYEYSSSKLSGQGSETDHDEYTKEITDPNRVNALNNFFNKNASTSSTEEVLTGYPGKEKNEYRVRNGVWQRRAEDSFEWVDIYNNDSIKSLNSHFNKDVKLSHSAKSKYYGVVENVDKDNFDKNISLITSSLVGKEEDEVTSILKRSFPDFTFRAKGAFTDEMTVTAPNGEDSIHISLDNWTDKDDASQANVLREFIKLHSSKKLTEATKSLSEAEKENENVAGINIGLRHAKPGDKEYIADTPEYMQPLVATSKFVSTEEKKTLEEKEVKAREEYAKQMSYAFSDAYETQKMANKKGSKITDEDVVSAYAALPKNDDTSKRMNSYANDVSMLIKDYQSKVDEFNRYSSDITSKIESGEISKEQYESTYKQILEQKTDELNKYSESIRANSSDLMNLNKSLDKSIAQQYIINESKGSVIGGLANRFVKGMTYIPRLLSSEITKDDQENIVKAIVGEGTTEEFMSSENRSDITKAALSLAESMGILASSAMMGGGNVAYAGFFSQSFYEMKDELDEVEGMSEFEKVLMASTYGAVSGALEKFGLDFALDKTGAGKNITRAIMKNVISDLPKNASKEAIDAAIINSTKNFLISSGIKLTGAGLVEGGTEALQATSKIGIQELYDNAKNTDYFNNKSGWEIFSDVVYEGYLGALGGGIMSTASQSKQIIDRGVKATLNKDQIELLMNSAKMEGMSESLLANLKAGILSGKISRQQAEEINKSFAEVKAKIDSMPEGMSTEDKAVSLDLMIEKDKLETEIKGKDENLVARQKERIAEINNTLQNISRNAVQEQATSEVPVQPEATVGEEVVEGKPEPQVTTEEGKKEVTAREIVNRPATLSEFGGNKFDSPLKGDLYVEGQQVVFEDRESGRIYELGNVDQVMDTQIPGLDVEQENISITPNGQVSIDGTNWNIQVELPTQGIEYNPAGEVTRVSLKDDAGNTKMFDGQQAIDIAYQIELQKYQTEEQQQFINDLLEQDEEFQAATEFIKPTETKAVVEEETVADTVQAEPKAEIDQEVEQLGNLIDATNVDEKVEKIPNKKIRGQVSNAVKALAKIAPKVKFIVHDSEESYKKATGETDRNQASNGTYMPDTKEIHINASRANARTVAHEVFHAILLDRVVSDEQAAKVTKRMIDAISSRLDKDSATKKYLDEFASNYDENIKNEEKLAELVGVLSENYQSQPDTIKDIIKRWLNKLADMFGLQKVTSEQEVMDTLNTIARKVAKGKAIKEKDVAKTIGEKRTGKLSDRFQADFSDTVSKLTFVYDKNGSKFKQLEKDGYITKDKSLSDFNGKYIFLHQPDAAFSGEIYKNGELLIEGKGGVFYPIKFHEDGYFWASTDTTAEKMASDLNAVMEQNGGTIFMALTSAPYDKLLSSTTAANGVLDLIMSKAFDSNFKLSEAQFKNAIRNAANHTVVKKTLVTDKNGNPILDKKGNKQYKEKPVGLGLKLPASMTVDQIVSSIKESLGADVKSFADRKTFTTELIRAVSEHINKSDVSVEQFGKFFSEGIQNKYFKGITKTGKVKVSATNMTQAISEMLTEPILKEGVNRDKGGQVYAILELNGPVKPVKSDKHESYPMAIQSDSDSKVKLHVLTDRQNWFDVFEDFETGDIVSDERQKKVFPTSGVSVRGLRLNTDRKQISDRKQLLAPNGKPSNLNEKQWHQVRTPEFKKWFGDWENNPKKYDLIDSNGEPMVWWHTGGNWNELKNGGIDGTGKLMFSPTKASMAYGSDAKNNIQITRPFFIKSDYIYMLPYEDRNSPKKYKWNKSKKNPVWFVNAYGGFIVVRNNEQIKSADENVGTFSPEEKSIRKQISDFIDRKQGKTASSIVSIARKNGFSEAAIQKYLRDKGFSAEEISRAMTVNESVDIDRLFEESKQALLDKRRKNTIGKALTFAKEKAIDRQTRIKRIIAKTGETKRTWFGKKSQVDEKAKRAHDLLVTRAGAKGYSNYRFKQADKKIYKGLKKADRDALDKMIYVRRIIAVNENRAERGVEAYKAKDGYSESEARRDLDKMREELGEKKFNDLMDRAKSYFEVFETSLKHLYESGRISEETYNNLKDIEYSPISTIKYIIGDNSSFEEIDKQAEVYGITRKDIMALTDNNENDVIMDSRWLLMMNLMSVEARAFENRMLNAFADALNSSSQETIDALSEYVMFAKEDGTGAPAGFKRVNYFVDGKQKALLVRGDVANQLLDVKNRMKGLETLGKLTGTQILRFFATGGNPLFIVGNTAVDFANVLFFTDVYSPIKVVGGAQLSFDFMSKFLGKIIQTGGYKQLYEEYMKYGGAMDFLASEGLRELKNARRSTYKAISLAQGTLLKVGNVMSYLGETSEQAMRLAVFGKVKSDLIAEFKKNNEGKMPEGQDLEDILFEAARESRETIDFSQGGDWAKNADLAMPYLNASLQGFRKPFEYAEKNPAGFASSVLQAGLLASSVTYLSVAALSRAIGGDDDEEKAKKIKEALESISEHEKSTHHIVFTGEKDKNGEYKYIRIKKLPVLSIMTTWAEQLAYKNTIESMGGKYDMNSIMDAVKSSSPILPENLIDRNPVLGGALGYYVNKNFFYGEDIFKNPSDNVIKPEAEGINDNNVAPFFKWAAPKLGLSPIRSQYFFEKVFTSPSTNPMVGAFYSLSSGMPLDESLWNALGSVKESGIKKLYRSTNKNLISYAEQEKLEEKRIDLNTEKYLKETKVYSTIKKAYEDGGKGLTEKELVDLVKKNFDPIDHEKYVKKYYLYTKRMDVPRSVIDILYEDNPEMQGYMIYKRYGSTFEKEEIEELNKALNAAGRSSVSDKTIFYYRKYANKK